MTIYLLYRKPQYHKTWPWFEWCRTADEAVKFMEKLGDEYKFRVFEEISVSELRDMAEVTD